MKGDTQQWLWHLVKLGRGATSTHPSAFRSRPNGTSARKSREVITPATLFPQKPTPANFTELSDDAVGWLFRPVEDLELSVRALNCLRIADIRYVGDLVTRTPASLKNLQNLGIKTLRELHFTATRLGLQLGMTVPNWPPSVLEKLGPTEFVCLAPSYLRAFLDLATSEAERIAQELVKQTQNAKAADNREVIADELKVRLVRRIAEFNLSVRASNVFIQENVVYLGDLVQRTETELLRCYNFGRKSLSEIKNVLADAGLDLGMHIPDWSHEKASEWEQRFASECQRLRLKEAHRRLPIPGRTPKTIEEELLNLALVYTRNSERNAEIVIKLHGWDGGGKRTLEVVGREYGLTRERVRQITLRFAQKLHGKTVLLPLVDRTLQHIMQRCPSSAEMVERELATRGLSKNPFRIEGLQLVAELTGRSTDFEIHKVGGVRFVISPSFAEPTSRVLSHARRSVKHWGCATIEDLIEQVSADTGAHLPPNFTQEVVTTQDDFHWLDEGSGWFWLAANARNRMINYIEKILAVASQIHISELRSAVSRHHQMAGIAPPRHVLLELCRQLPNCRVEGAMVIGDPSPTAENVLSDTELHFWHVLRQHGPVAARENLERLCVGGGMNRNTFHIYLGYTPIIARFGRSVYGLVGSAVSPGLVESLTPVPKRGRVLVDYGWTAEGRIWLGYQLSRSALNAGVFHVPSAMKDFVEGTYNLLTPDGAAFGSITIKDSSIWSLTKFFSRRGGEPGDILVLTLDPLARQALAQIGGGDLLDRYASGDEGLPVNASPDKEE